jgi:two-component sensor histidine kinase
MCTTLGLESERQGVLAVILNELLSNALDHGVLGLDSSIKNHPEGFELYFESRYQRLAALLEGEIHIDIRQQGHPQGNSLQVQITDSGAGFDMNQLCSPPDRSPLTHYHGRGLELVRNLCQLLEFQPPGNSVIAELHWGGCPQTETGSSPAAVINSSRASLP